MTAPIDTAALRELLDRSNRLGVGGRHEILKALQLRIPAILTELDAARARIDALITDLSVNGWQPIETAPKDGTLILLSLPEGVVATCWDEWAPGEFYFGSDIVEYEGATHWRPLPAPPAVDAAIARDGEGS